MVRDKEAEWGQMEERYCRGRERGSIPRDRAQGKRKAIEL
jgi:hypothetical protein